MVKRGRRALPSAAAPPAGDVKQRRRHGRPRAATWRTIHRSPLSLACRARGSSRARWSRTHSSATNLVAVVPSPTAQSADVAPRSATWPAFQIRPGRAREPPRLSSRRRCPVSKVPRHRPQKATQDTRPGRIRGAAPGVLLALSRRSHPAGDFHHAVSTDGTYQTRGGLSRRSFG